MSSAVKRIIRWQGLVAFIAFSLVLFALFYLFSGVLTKWAIESAGAKYTGAEVNVESAELALMPTMVTVYGLQATDPKAPEFNMAAFTKAKASVSLWDYLLGRIIIDDLQVEELSLNSPRKTAGEVYRTTSVKDQIADVLSDDYLSDIEAQLPSVDTVLENSNLKTVKRAQALEQSYQQESEKLKQLKAQLPSKDKLKTYEQKVKALTKVKIKTPQDLAKLKQDFEQLKKEFKADKEAVTKIKDEVVTSKNLLTKQITDLKNAPQEDWQDIQQQYQLQTFEAADLAHMLFGEEARKYMQFAEIALEYAQPFLDKSGTGQEQVAADFGQGRFVHFEQEDGMPSFWLKNGKVSLALPQGSYELAVKDITHQHWLISKESQVSINTLQADQLGDIQFNSNFAVDLAQQITADGNWDLANLALNNLQLANSDSMALELVKAVLAGSGKFNVNKGMLDLVSDFNLNGSDFSGNASSKMAKILVDALAGVDTLSFDIGAVGDMFNPEWSVDTSLNNLLASALNQQISGKLAEYQSSVTSGLNGKMQGALNLGDQQQSQLLNLEALVGDSDKALENLLNNDIVKQKKKELENKAKDKLKEKLGKLFG